MADIIGSGEFLLMRKGSDKVYLVVRTINSAAFSSHDWEEYVVSASPFRSLYHQVVIFQADETGPLQVQHQI